MSKLIDYMTERVIKNIPISNIPRLKNVDITSKVDNVEYILGKQYELSLSYKSRVTVTSEEELHQAKLHLLTKFKYILYNEFLDNLYEIKDALLDRDLEAALTALDKTLANVRG